MGLMRGAGPDRGQLGVPACGILKNEGPVDMIMLLVNAFVAGC